MSYQKYFTNLQNVVSKQWYTCKGARFQGSPKEFFNRGANLRNVMQSLYSIHLKVENNEEFWSLH